LKIRDEFRLYKISTLYLYNLIIGVINLSKLHLGFYIYELNLALIIDFFLLAISLIID
jgi:hypothetical protein